MSNAFIEYAAARCDEILAENEEYHKLELKILEAGKNLTDVIDHKDIEKYLRYEELVVKQQSIANIAIFSNISNNPNMNQKPNMNQIIKAK